ncbi:MAG: hypothetical protein M3116_07510 [Actinomycetota bacterium]|nr:hypothetical protein [Actinomycetota bacterium]
MPDAGWSEVLDDLERRLAHGVDATWSQPVGLGPLPAELVPRASALAAAQRATIAAAEGELHRLEREMAALRRPSVARAAERPAYIDTVA